MPPRPPAGGRRNTTLTVVAVAAIVAGLIGVILSLTLHARPSQAQTNQPPRNRPAGLGAGQRSTTGARATGEPTSRVNAPAGQAAATDPAAAGTVSSDPVTSGAAAVTNPRQVCGAAFQVIDSAPLRGPDGVLAGRVFLLFNPGTGRNCTTTLKSEQVGVASPTSAYLEVQGAARVTASGSFQFFAGPVRAAAATRCVKWGGSVGDATFDSPFEHCG